jgi:hypothetical protein
VTEAPGVGTSQSLLEAGWVRRYLADPQRAQEAVETYGAAGFEVHLQQLAPADFATTCAGCAATVCASYVVVYTRKNQEEST